jgi:hypothetical protein
VTRPRVTGALGAADQQQLEIRGRPQHERDRGLAHSLGLWHHRRGPRFQHATQSLKPFVSDRHRLAFF